MKPAVLFAMALFAGCMQPPASPGSPEPDDPILPEESLPRHSVQMDDCYYLLGFVPMEWTAAEALLPTGFTPITWTIDDDRSLAILEVLFADCAQAFVDDVPVGPATSLWLQPDVDASSFPLLDQNNFHAYSAHSNEAVLAIWAALGPAEAGGFDVVHDAPGRAAVVTAKAASLDAAITFHETDAISGSVTSTWRIFYESEAGVGTIDQTEEGARGTFPGGLSLVLAKAPFPLAADAASGITTGFGNGHGALDSIRFVIREPMA